MFNDSPISNRIYAYLANIPISKFNKLEMEVLKRLGHNALISLQEYKNYEEALKSYWKHKKDVLDQCFVDYKHDKLILKEIKGEIHAQQQQSERGMIDSTFIKNYNDPQISGIFEKSSVTRRNHYSIASGDKFRFESYNSHNFKENYKKTRLRRSWSVPLLMS